MSERAQRQITESACNVQTKCYGGGGGGGSRQRSNVFWNKKCMPCHAAKLNRLCDPAQSWRGTHGHERTQSENGAFPAGRGPRTADRCLMPAGPRRAHALSTHAGSFSFHFEPLRSGPVRGGARAAKVRRHHHHRASVPAPEATARALTTPCPAAAVRGGVRGAAFLPFPAPVLSCLRRPSPDVRFNDTPLSPPAGRSPAAVRAKAPDMAPRT